MMTITVAMISIIALMLMMVHYFMKHEVWNMLRLIESLNICMTYDPEVALKNSCSEGVLKIYAKSLKNTCTGVHFSLKLLKIISADIFQRFRLDF